MKMRYQSLQNILEAWVRIARIDEDGVLGNCFHAQVFDWRNLDQGWIHIKGKVPSVIVSFSTFQYLKYLLLGANEPCEKSGEGIYVLRSKSKGNGHRKGGDEK